MKFLKEVGYTEEEINDLKANLSQDIYEKLNTFPTLVYTNLKFLKDLGVRNIKEVFARFSKLFLKDNKEFEKTFLKYDKEDLIEKIEKNPGIMEYL